MPIEFEYKFVVENLPEGRLIRSHTNIEQIYITNDDERFMTTRARKIYNSVYDTEDYTVTHKIGCGPSVMETEHGIGSKNYEELKEHFSINEIIYKTRMVFKIDGNYWDVDIFENDMIVAEIEDPPEDLIVPKDFGGYVDVTHNGNFKNSFISVEGLPTRNYLNELKGKFFGIDLTTK